MHRPLFKCFVNSISNFLYKSTPSNCNQLKYETHFIYNNLLLILRKKYNHHESIRYSNTIIGSSLIRESRMTVNNVMIISCNPDMKNEKIDQQTMTIVSRLPINWEVLVRSRSIFVKFDMLVLEETKLELAYIIFIKLITMSQNIFYQIKYFYGIHITIYWGVIL